MNIIEPCSTCGGDRRIANSFGSTTTCPSCHGSGRRTETTGFHDVTKTKPAHFTPSNRAPVEVKQTWPLTGEGIKLANDVKDSASLSPEAKTKMTREIIDHEKLHGTCTQTFIKKMRKQVKPRSA
jgi:hypothetical protein